MIAVLHIKNQSLKKECWLGMYLKIEILDLKVILKIPQNISFWMKHGRHRNFKEHVVVFPHSQVIHFKILMTCLWRGRSAGECSQGLCESGHQTRRCTRWKLILSTRIYHEHAGRLFGQCEDPQCQQHSPSADIGCYQYQWDSRVLSQSSSARRKSWLKQSQAGERLRKQRKPFL